MFKDKSDYELAMPHLMEIWEDDARELIETLRGVARAAKEVRGVVGDCTCVKCNGLWKALTESLDALPAWVMEDSDG